LTFSDLDYGIDLVFIQSTRFNPDPLKLKTMKRSTFKTLLIFAQMMMGGSVFAQKTYTLSTSANWSAILRSSCYACTISIASGTTLTMDVAATCQNCVFQGGTLSINNQTLNPVGGRIRRNPREQHDADRPVITVAMAPHVQKYACT
jgi:hypothetical protein